MTELLDPSHFSEYWTAGLKSEYEVFCATLKWVDDALEGPVAHDRWAQILFTLEQLPLTCSVRMLTFGMVRVTDCAVTALSSTDKITSYPPSTLHAMRRSHAGARKLTRQMLLKKIELAFGFGQGERWFGTIVCDEQVDNERVRSGTFYGELVLISKRAHTTSQSSRQLGRAKNSPYST